MLFMGKGGSVLTQRRQSDTNWVVFGVLRPFFYYVPVAQLEVQRVSSPQVVGSSPTGDITSVRSSAG